jgi:hypothetical protein
MPKWFKPFVFEIVLMLDFIQEEIILLSYSVQIREELVGAYGSYGEEEMCIEAFDRET